MPWSWTHLKFNFSIFKTAVLGTPQDKIRPSLAAPGHWRSLVTSLAGASWAVPCNGLALLLDDMAHPHRDVSITCEKIMFCKLKPHKDGISSGKRGCSKIKKWIEHIWIMYINLEWTWIAESMRPTPGCNESTGNMFLNPLCGSEAASWGCPVQGGLPAHGWLGQESETIPCWPSGPHGCHWSSTHKQNIKQIPISGHTCKFGMCNSNLLILPLQ